MEVASVPYIISVWVGKVKVKCSKVNLDIVYEALHKFQNENVFTIGCLYYDTVLNIGNTWTRLSVYLNAGSRVGVKLKEFTVFCVSGSNLFG